MKTMAIALLATAVIGAPAIAASNNQQPQMNHQMQPQNNAQDQAQPQGQTTGSAAQRDQQNEQQRAQNDQAISPHSLAEDQVKQVQQALEKSGFKAGRVDGRWGPETASAVKQFQQSKQIKPHGQLDRQTLADLGLDASQFQGGQK